MDHQENYPSKFSDVSPEYADSPTLFHCPSDTNGIGEISSVDQWSSYTLIPRDTNALPCDIHVFCPPSNHDNRGGNILFVDGSVVFLNTPDFEKLMREQGIVFQ